MQLLFLSKVKKYDVAAGAIVCTHKMGQKPNILYTDDEGALHKPSIQTQFKDPQIFHYITQNHAGFAERFIITFKLMLCRRIDHGKVDNP